MCPEAETADVVVVVVALGCCCHFWVVELS